MLDLLRVPESPLQSANTQCKSFPKRATHFRRWDLHTMHVRQQRSLSELERHTGCFQVRDAPTPSVVAHATVSVYCHVVPATNLKYERRRNLFAVRLQLPDWE